MHIVFQNILPRALVSSVPIVFHLYMIIILYAVFILHVKFSELKQGKSCCFERDIFVYFTFYTLLFKVSDFYYNYFIY
jgi:hypothetical protein